MEDLNDFITGDTLTAAQFIQPMSEVQNIIEDLAIALSAGDLNQLGKAIAGYVANSTFYTDSGIADAYVLSKIGLKQTPTAYTDGFAASFLAGNVNTGGASTVNVAALGVKNIKLKDGSNPLAEDISGRVQLSFDTANDRFELLNPKVSRPFVTLKDFGAKGDDSTNDTAAFDRFAVAGGGLITDGTYLIDDITISNKVKIIVEPGASLKKRSGTTSDSILISFVAGSEGSEWFGGSIDGDRANLTAAYNSVNPTFPGFFDGWFGMKTAAERITVSGVEFKNWVSKPFWFAGDYNIISNIDTLDHGDAGLFGWEWFGSGKFASRPVGQGALRQEVNNIRSLRADNNGVAAVIQHAIDLTNCKDGWYSNLSVFEQGGDTSGISTFASGITAEICESCTFDNWKYADPITDTLKHLGISMLGCKNTQINHPQALNLAGIGLELNACIDCPISSPLLDGKYRATSIVPAGDGQSLGLSYFAGAFNSDRDAKSVLASTGCEVTGGKITRFSSGANMRGAEHELNGVNIIGNIIDGIVNQEELFTDDFTGANLAHNRLSIYTNCIVENNGAIGLSAISYKNIKVNGGSFSNNGQDTSVSANSRAGINAVAGDFLSVIGVSIDDSQNWTDTNLCSYEPQSSDSNNLVKVFMRAMGRISVGQFITLTNALGPGDVTGKVFDIDENDVVTLQTSAPVTLSSTGNTTALTGTWTGSGKTLTGVGTLATTEIRGPTFVTDGTEFKRVVKAISNTSIIIESAFATALSADTLNELTVDVSGIPSQQNGIRAFGAATNLLFAKNTYEGNVLNRTNISTPSNCLYGCEYFRKSSTTTDLATVNLQTQIAAGHKLIGIATNNDVAISGGGATDYELKLTDSGGSTLESIQTGISLAQNTKITGALLGSKMLASGNLLRATFSGGTPTAGTIAAEAFYKVDGVPALPNT